MVRSYSDIYAAHGAECTRAPIHSPIYNPIEPKPSQQCPTSHSDYVDRKGEPPCIFRLRSDLFKISRFQKPRQTIS